VRQQEIFVEGLKNKDNQLLDLCIESSYKGLIEEILKIQNYYKQVREQANKEDNKIIEEFCKNRIWFWSIRVSYVTGESNYVANPISYCHNNSGEIIHPGMSIEFLIGKFDIDRADAYFDNLESLIFKNQEKYFSPKIKRIKDPIIQFFSVDKNLKPNLHQFIMHPLLKNADKIFSEQLEMAFYHDPASFNFESFNEDWFETLIELISSTNYKDLEVNELIRVDDENEDSTLLFARLNVKQSDFYH